MRNMAIAITGRTNWTQSGGGIEIEKKKTVEKAKRYAVEVKSRTAIQLKLPLQVQPANFSTRQQ